MLREAYCKCDVCENKLKIWTSDPLVVPGVFFFESRVDLASQLQTLLAGGLSQEVAG